MTEQEAINLLCQMYLSYFSTEEKQALTTAIESLQKLSIYKQIKWERDVALDQLESIGVGLGRKMDDVKEAMEKQIPKKPDTECDDWICPNCKEEYDIDFDKYDYCPKCGQAIDNSFKDFEVDWGEEE